MTFYSNVNGNNTFLVTTDGVEQLQFDRMYPAERTGADADSFTDAMLAAGFIFDEEEARAANDDGMRDEVAGAALM